LDGRIRKLAREEATQALLDSIKSPSAEMAAAGGTVQAVDVQQQITDLHEHLHQAATVIKRLEDRVDVLEKTASVSDQAKTVSRRGTARKESTE
jgi:hypothetical protein